MYHKKSYKKVYIANKSFPIKSIVLYIHQLLSSNTKHENGALLLVPYTHPIAHILLKNVYGKVLVVQQHPKNESTTVYIYITDLI